MTLTMRFATPLLAALAALIPGGCASSEMTHEAMHQHHTIDYIEFSVRDLSEAKRLYGAAFACQKVSGLVSTELLGARFRLKPSVIGQPSSTVFS